MNVDVGVGAPAPTNNNEHLVKHSNAWTSYGTNYRTGIISAIIERKDRMGSSLQKIREHMKATMTSRKIG